ncbi:unnamed protein product [Pichia kudriavzevii]
MISHTVNSLNAIMCRYMASDIKSRESILKSVYNDRQNNKPISEVTVSQYGSLTRSIASYMAFAFEMSCSLLRQLSLREQSFCKSLDIDLREHLLALEKHSQVYNDYCTRLLYNDISYRVQSAFLKCIDDLKTRFVKDTVSNRRKALAGIFLQLCGYLKDELMNKPYSFFYKLAILRFSSLVSVDGIKFQISLDINNEEANKINNLAKKLREFDMNSYLKDHNLPNNLETYETFTFTSNQSSTNTGSSNASSLYRDSSNKSNMFSNEPLATPPLSTKNQTVPGPEIPCTPAISTTSGSHLTLNTVSESFLGLHQQQQMRVSENPNGLEQHHFRYTTHQQPTRNHAQPRIQAPKITPEQIIEQQKKMAKTREFEATHRAGIEAKALEERKRAAEAEAEARRKAEAEAKALEERKRAAEAEARRKAEAEAKALEERKRAAEAEARRKAEAEAKALEERKRAAEAEARRKAEAEAKALEERKRAAEAEARRKAEAEAKALEERKRAAEVEAEEERQKQKPKHLKREREQRKRKQDERQKQKPKHLKREREQRKRKQDARQKQRPKHLKREREQRKRKRKQDARQKQKP